MAIEIKSISELAAATTATGAVFACLQDGVAKQIPVSLLQALINAIPLSGTEVGSPVTGDIEFTNGAKLFRGITDYSNTVGDSFELTALRTKVGDKETYFGVFSESGESGYQLIYFNTTTGAFSSFDGYNWVLKEDNRTIITLTSNSVVIDFNANPLAEGLVGAGYYGANYGDNTYVQKKYVDQLTPKVANDFADDAAAAIGGIGVGQVYHTAGVVKIRLV